MKFNQPARIALVCGAALVWCGCGSREDLPVTTTVSGTVTFKGETLKEGTVMFHPQGQQKSHPATGEIGENGIFTLSTFAESDGAIVGNHVVTVQIFPKGANPGFEDQAAGYVPIPVKYTDPKTSDLLVEVKPGPNTLNLTLEDKK